MVRRYGLRDDQWERMEHVLPGREATVGVTAKDTRLFGEAVMYRYRTGIPWRDLPERFGDGKTHHRRHRRGSESRVWQRAFAPLAEDADNEDARIDSTSVRAHPPSASAKGGAGKRNASGAAKAG